MSACRRRGIICAVSGSYPATVNPTSERPEEGAPSGVETGTERRPSVARWAWWLVAVLAAASVLPVLFGGQFVLDDVPAVTRSACIRGDFDLTRLTSSNFWCEPEGAQTIDAWRPLPMLIWWPLWRVSGGSPVVFHLLGLVLHVITSLGLVRLLERLGATPRASVLAGVLFAVLPIHVDATASVVGQAETLAGALGQRMREEVRSHSTPQAEPHAGPHMGQSCQHSGFPLLVHGHASLLFIVGAPRLHWPDGDVSVPAWSRADAMPSREDCDIGFPARRRERC